jgi:hypothetical protein
MAEYRFPLELQGSPFVINMNYGPVYDHSAVYIYRILPLPITMKLSFIATGLSYVEVFDADGQRFLLGEKLEINSSIEFSIDWDGVGVFEPRVWKDSQVTAITLSFALPGTEVIPDIKPKFNAAPYVLGGGAVFGVSMAATRFLTRRGK